MKPKKATPGFLLTWSAVRRAPRKDDIYRNNKLNNKITIISIEQTAAPLQPSRGASVEYVQNETSYETTNYIIFCLCATSLLLNSLHRILRMSESSSKRDRPPTSPRNSSDFVLISGTNCAKVGSTSVNTVATPQYVFVYQVFVTSTAEWWMTELY